MDENELAVRRTQMGHAVAGFAMGSGMEHRVEPGWWLALTGAPGPDANMALVHQRDESALAGSLQRFEDRDCPALVMLAGEGRELSGGFPGGWESVGSMPIMTLDLTTAATAGDARVRLVGAEDYETMTDLLVESYGMVREVAGVMAGPTQRGESVLQSWLLEDGGQAVSTVMTSRIDDTVSVWAMGTPERFGRRGYGRALLGDVLDRARKDGATIGLLGATPAGQPLYEATGWKTVEDWQIFTNAESAQFSH